MKHDRQTRVCPRCGMSYTGHPALSRYVNVSICSDCGTDEALRPWCGLGPLPTSDWAYTPKVAEEELEVMR